MHQLTDLLGDDHNLAVLRGIVHADPSAYGARQALDAVTALVDRRRTELLRDAQTLGRHCLAEPPAAFVARLGVHWRTWQAESQEAGPPADAVVLPAGRKG